MLLFTKLFVLRFLTSIIPSQESTAAFDVRRNSGNGPVTYFIFQVSFEQNLQNTSGSCRCCLCLFCGLSNGVFLDLLYLTDLVDLLGALPDTLSMLL